MWLKCVVKVWGYATGLLRCRIGWAHFFVSRFLSRLYGRGQNCNEKTGHGGYIAVQCVCARGEKKRGGFIY